MTVTPAGEWLTHVHVAKGVKSHLIFKLVAIITFLSIPSKYVLRLDFFNISQHNDAPLTHTLCKNHMAFSKKNTQSSSISAKLGELFRTVGTLLSNERCNEVVENDNFTM